MTTSRRLAAIMVADVVGYSRMMEADEVGTLASLKQRRKEVLEPVVTSHGGRIVKVMGDGVLIEFPSAVNAVTGAVELQKRMTNANAGQDLSRQIVLRIGINLGDVIGEGSDIYGEGVNIAARLEPLAEPGGLCISGKVYDEVRGKAEVAFEEIGEHSLKNIAQPVRCYRLSAGQQPVKNQVGSNVSATTIAVLPFDNMSGDASQQYLSDGITEDIITELARFRNLAVTARHASFHHRGAGLKLGEVARELGVAYIVEGSVRKSGEQIRVTVQLIDTKTLDHIWADRYDRNARDMIAVQTEVVSAIVATLEGRIVAASAAGVRTKPTASWTAYDHLLQGRDLCNNYREPDSIDCFRRAIALDPNFALAHAWLALALTVAFNRGGDARLIEEADTAVQSALRLGPKEATSHWAAGMLALWTARHDEAGRHFDRAILLNPADPQIKADRAMWLRFCGRHQEALDTIDYLVKDDPYSPSWFLQVRAETLFDLRRYAETLSELMPIPEKMIRVYLYLGATYAYLNDRARAAEAIASALQLQPGLRSSSLQIAIPFTDQADRDHLLAGLRKAGLPE